MLNMFQTSKTVILLLLSFLHFKFINGMCNVCQPENMAACHNETTYSICIVDNLPTQDLITCPENLICTNGIFICYPRDERAAACIHADQIDDVTESNVSPSSSAGGGSYDPTDDISLSVSTDSGNNDLDDTTTDELIASSSATESNSSSTNQNTVSSSTESETSSSLTTTRDSEKSTPDETTVTTKTTRATTTTAKTSTEVTTKSPRNPETLCREVQASGSYINELDSTCKSYVRCMGTKAYEFSCPVDKWFDAQQGFCINTKPTECI